jgi:hypothetical protein
MRLSPARVVSAALALLMLAGCGTAADGDAGFADRCAARGLSPGSDAYMDCLEQLRLQQQMDLERIRQARDLDIGSTKL